MHNIDRPLQVTHACAALESLPHLSLFARKLCLFLFVLFKSCILALLLSSSFSIDTTLCAWSLYKVKINAMVGNEKYIKCISVEATSLLSNRKSFHCGGGDGGCCCCCCWWCFCCAFLLCGLIVASNLMIYEDDDLNLLLCPLEWMANALYGKLMYICLKAEE